MKILVVLSLCIFGSNAWMDQCGQSKYPDPAREQSINRIVGGWDSRENEFPYQLSLRYRLSQNHFCGAVIINENWAITAAHCTEGDTALELEVVAGKHLRTGTSSTEIILPISELIEHEGFDETDELENDIALLRFESPLSMTANIQPACKPRDIDYAGGRSTVSGWGALFSGGPSPDILQYTNVDVYTDDDCESNYPGEILPGMVCAAVPNERDTCQGDSGGPMAVLNNGKFEVIGLTSWGEGCAGNKPGVYTRVSFFLQWIKDNGGSN